MTQAPIEKKPDWLVTVSSEKKFEPALQAACYDHEYIGKLLKYILCLAAYEIEHQHLAKGCKVVKFTRKLDDILKNLKFKASKKTLIRYLCFLNEWEYVGSQKYQREFTVYIENIQKAVDNPPAPKAKPVYSRHPQKGCKVVDLQPLHENEQNEVMILRQNVVDLQHKVDNLQQNVVDLQHKVDTMSTLQRFISELGEAGLGHFFEAISSIVIKDSITNRVIKDSIYVDVAHADIDTHTQSSFSDSQQQVEEPHQDVISDQQDAPTDPLPASSGIIAHATQQNPRIEAGDVLEAVPQNPLLEQASGVSYSPVAQAKSEDVVDGDSLSLPKPEKPKRSRKPKVVIDGTLQVRIDRVYEFFDKIAQEASGVEGFHYTPTAKSNEAILAWLKSNPTEELLREVYNELWNTPVDTRSGYDWKKNMKVHVVLNEYSSRALAIQAKRKKKEEKKITSSAPASLLPSFVVLNEEPAFPVRFKSASQQRLQRKVETHERKTVASEYRG